MAELGSYDFVAEAAEAYIDAWCGRTWLGGAVTGERHTIQQGRVWLYQRPITAVSAVRIGSPFETATTLVVSTDYVVDLTRGLLTFRSATYGLVDVSVDYTVPTTVPADVAQAATELTKAWLGSSTITTAIADLTAAGMYKQVSLDGESRTYRDLSDLANLTQLSAVPPSVEQLLSRYRRLVLA